MLATQAAPERDLGKSAPEPDPPAPPACALCGDVEFVPVAVCEDFEARTCSSASLALRCSSCGSVVLHPLPPGSASPRADEDRPSWLLASAELRLAERYRRAA